MLRLVALFRSLDSLWDSLSSSTRSLRETDADEIKYAESLSLQHGFNIKEFGEALDDQLPKARFQIDACSLPFATYFCESS